MIDAKPWSAAWFDAQPGVSWEKTAPGVIILRVPVTDVALWQARLRAVPMGLEVRLVPMGGPCLDTAFAAVAAAVFNGMVADLVAGGWYMHPRGGPDETPSAYWWAHPAARHGHSITAAWLTLQAGAAQRAQAADEG